MPVWAVTFLTSLFEPLIQKAIDNAFAELKAVQKSKWKDDLGEIQNKLAGTMTLEEKDDAASKLAALIARLN